MKERVSYLLLLIRQNGMILVEENWLVIGRSTDAFTFDPVIVLLGIHPMYTTVSKKCHVCKVIHHGGV